MTQGSSKLRNLMMTILCQLVIYLVQFVVVPVFVDIYPSDTLRGTLAICVSTLFLSFGGMTKISRKYHYWIVGIIPYTMLLFFYRPYGITDGFWGVDIPIISLLVLANEFAIWVIVITINKVRKA
jgi:hypothetical protein